MLQPFLFPIVNKASKQPITPRKFPIRFSRFAQNRFPQFYTCLLTASKLLLGGENDVDKQNPTYEKTLHFFQYFTLATALC